MARYIWRQTVERDLIKQEKHTHHKEHDRIVKASGGNTRKEIIPERDGRKYRRGSMFVWWRDSIFSSEPEQFLLPCFKCALYFFDVFSSSSLFFLVTGKLEALVSTFAASGVLQAALELHLRRYLEPFFGSWQRFDHKGKQNTRIIFVPSKRNVKEGRLACPQTLKLRSESIFARRVRPALSVDQFIVFLQGYQGTLY